MERAYVVVYQVLNEVLNPFKYPFELEKAFTNLVFGISLPMKQHLD
jgi:hypothetical protein